MGCLDDNTLARLLEGGDAADLRGPREHLAGCAPCRALLAGASGLDEAQAPERVLGPGSTLGRYVILELIGAGAMGVVYAAYDPQLSRKVALKRLRPDPFAARDSEAARARLLREAQALARLSHPHVIAIHDVGTLDGEVFLAMEFAEGGTLGQWLRAKQRAWREVLALLLEAGEGLAAAHEAGLVHRDLKPENILIGAQGRARVTDFGLAREAAKSDSKWNHHRSVNIPVSNHLQLTATGALLGTPAYMAPEQLKGQPATALSDQFSFAATLHEALTGERPFAGANADELLAAIEKGELRGTPADRAVPDWLRRVVQRGLSAEPARRFPSVRAMLEALRRGPLVSPRRLAIGMAALLLIGLAGWAIAREPQQLCSGANAAWDGAWDPARAARVKSSFASTGRPAAESAAAFVATSLGAEAERWRALHQGICEATRRRGEQSEQLLDLRMRCLAERRDEVAALGRLFENADGALVDQAIAATLALPPLEPCASVHANGPPLPAEEKARAQVARLEGEVAEENALNYAGRYADGLAKAKQTSDGARALGWTPLEARALLARGNLERGRGLDFSAAANSLHEAAQAAQAAHDDLIAADAWTALIRVSGFNQSQPQLGELWARYAQAALERAGGDDEREATRLRFLATVEWLREGRRDEARALIERAKALYEKVHGPHLAFQRTSCDEGIAGILFDQAKPAEALALHRQILEARTALFGAQHLSLAVAKVNLGEDLLALGRPAEAEPLLEQAVEQSKETPSSQAYALHRLAAALRALGKPEAALERDRASLAIANSTPYWDAWPRTGEGLDLLALGRPAEAIAPLELAVAARGPGTLPWLAAESRFALARALWPSDRARSTALANEAFEALRPDAERYQSWYARELDTIDAWRKSHAD